MDRGMYVSASGGLFQMAKLDVVNNNLSNINTPGFKKQILTGETQTFDQTLAKLVTKNDPVARGDQERTPGVVNLSTKTDFSAGPIKNTGNPLDVAIRRADDFFVINGPSGQEYTRAGNFTISAAGELVTQDGYQVIGDGGPVSVNGVGVSIAADGSVLANGQRTGRISVVHFDDPSSLERVAGARFKLKQGTQAPGEATADLEPLSLEMANVSAISSMIDLISAQRAFQAYTKSADTVDQLNNTAINQVGRVR